MTLLHPLALFGLVAAAIPTLLHLLARRKPPDVIFPAVRYLSEAERRSARRLRVRHVVLLLLRTAIIMMIVLAAARPLVPIAAGGVHEPTALAVIFDNSPSAGAVRDGSPVVERLRAAAHGSIAAVRPGDRAWLMLADGVARAGSREELLALVDSVSTAAVRLDLVAAVERASGLVAAEPLPGHEVHVVSDLQLSAMEAGAAHLTRPVHVLAVRFPFAGLANRGIGNVRVADGAVRLTIVGTPDAPSVAVTLRLLGGREVGRALGAPGDDLALPLPVLSPGWWVGEAELEPDELRADDRRLFAWRVAPPAAVAVAAAAGPFVNAAVAVLREGGRIIPGREVMIGEQSARGPSVLLPPLDPALAGQANRALAARGVTWRYGPLGTPGRIASEEVEGIAGTAVARRLRIEPTGDPTGAVLATVNGEPWLVRAADVVILGSRLDTAWTALPVSPAFVGFVDHLVNRLVQGETSIHEVEGPVGVAFAQRYGDTVGAIVSGPDPRESNLVPAAPAVVRRALGAAVVNEEGLAAARFRGTRRADAAGVLLALAFLLALVEMAVAWRTR